MRPNLRKRFYRNRHGGGGPPYPVLLDGALGEDAGGRLARGARRQLAQAIAAEWKAQGERIDPATMPLTRLANTIIDGVAPKPQPIADEIAQYLGSDLVCYRADDTRRAGCAQSRHWDPVLAWTREAHGARFVLSEGVTFVTQPEHAVAAVRAAIPVRSVAARRNPRRHDADRFGADRACACGGAARPWRGVGCRACG